MSMNEAEEKAAVILIRSTAAIILKAVDMANGKNIPQVRDCCIQALGILEVIYSQYSTYLSKHTKVLATCTQAIEAIAQDLNVPNITTTAVLSKKLNTHDNINNAHDISIVKPRQVKFSDLIGSNEAKIALHENIVMPMTMEESDKKQIFTGIRAGSGNVLLYGPPGTGKTCLAQAAAFEADAVFLSIRPSDILSKYQGESERYLNGVFQKARSFKKSIIFFDEFDSIAIARGGIDDGGQNRRLLAELLLQLTFNKEQTSSSCLEQNDDSRDGSNRHVTSTQSLRAYTVETDLKASQVKTNYGSTSKTYKEEDQLVVHVQDMDKYTHTNCVVVIAATNRIDDLDEAIMRRFDSKIYVGLPELQDRIVMIKHFMRGVDTSLSAYDLQTIADKTEGWSGSDIENLCRESAMAPIRAVIPLYSNRSSKSQERYYSNKYDINQLGCSGRDGYSNGCSNGNTLPITLPVRAIAIKDFNDAYAKLTQLGVDCYNSNVVDNDKVL